MKRRIIEVLFVSAALLLLAGCGGQPGANHPADSDAAVTDSVQESIAPSSQPTPTPQATDPVQIPPEEAAYQKILEEYGEVLHADSQAFLEHPEAYFQGDHAILQMYHRDRTTHQGDSFFYAYDDLDDNGTEELLIGFGWDGWINENPGAARVVDLYGFDGATAVQLMDEPTLGESSSMIMSEKGPMIYITFNGQGQPVVTEFRVEGCAVEKIRTYTSDSHTIEGLEQDKVLYWQPIR